MILEIFKVFTIELNKDNIQKIRKRKIKKINHDMTKILN